MNCTLPLPRLDTGPTAALLSVRGRYLELTKLERDTVTVCFRFTEASASPLGLDVWPISWLWESSTLNMRDRPWKGKERHARVCLWLRQRWLSGQFLWAEFKQNYFDPNSTFCCCPEAGWLCGRGCARMRWEEEASFGPALDHVPFRKAPSPLIATQDHRENRHFKLREPSWGWSKSILLLRGSIYILYVWKKGFVRGMHLNFSS